MRQSATEGLIYVRKRNVIKPVFVKKISLSFEGQAGPDITAQVEWAQIAHDALMAHLKSQPADAGLRQEGD